MFLAMLRLSSVMTSKWSEWPNYPHRDLQRAAQEHGLVLVVLEGEISPELVANEVAKDVEKHLPVSDRRGLTERQSPVSESPRDRSGVAEEPGAKRGRP